MTHNGPDNIMIFETGINLDMPRSSIQNALLEMNDNYLIQRDLICLHGKKLSSYSHGRLCRKITSTLSFEGQDDPEWSK